MLRDQPPVTAETRSSRCPRATDAGETIARPTNPDAGPSHVGPCDGAMPNAVGSCERVRIAMGASVVQRIDRVEGISQGPFLTNVPLVTVAERCSRAAR